MEQVVVTERLTLRPLTLQDLDTVHEYAGDGGNIQYMVDFPKENKKETEIFLTKAVAEWAKEKPAFYEFAIEQQGRHIGGVSLWLSEDRQEGELGWLLNQKYQGHGYATEAARAILQYAFTTLKVTKITASCDSRNEVSSKVMQKIGLLLEDTSGVRRNKNSMVDVVEHRYALQKK